MVLHLDNVVAFEVVVTEVEIFLRVAICFILLHAPLGLLLSLRVGIVLRAGFDLLGTLSKVVDMREVKYFSLLVFCEMFSE